MHSRGFMSKLTKLMVCVLALATLGGCKPLDDAMVAVLGRSMRDQRSFDPYENTRPAPEHSVAFAAGNYPSAPGVVNIGQPSGVDIPDFTQADVATPPLGSEVIQGLVNPTDPNDPESLARGEELFNRFCIVCHGGDGVAANANLARFVDPATGMPIHPTVLTVNNLSGSVVAGYSDAYIYAMIRVGRGLMPEYGSRISHFDRWNVVNYVRQLQRQAGN